MTPPAEPTAPARTPAPRSRAVSGQEDPDVSEARRPESVRAREETELQPRDGLALTRVVRLVIRRIDLRDRFRSGCSVRLHRMLRVLRLHRVHRVPPLHRMHRVFRLRGVRRCSDFAGRTGCFVFTGCTGCFVFTGCADCVEPSRGASGAPSRRSWGGPCQRWATDGPDPRRLCRPHCSSGLMISIEAPPE